MPDRSDSASGNPHLSRPGGRYLPAVRTSGPLLHLAGQVARRGEEMVATGIVGRDVDISTARECAAQCARNLLAHMEAATGDLARVAGLVRLNVYVCATADFTAHSAVADAASDVFLDALGERGRHARSAVGVVSLPRGSPVEADAVVQLLSEPVEPTASGDHRPSA